MLLFVVGFFRSGTSLLYALLNQNPAIALTYEGNLLKFWPALRAGGVRKDWQRRLEFWNQTFSRHGVDFTEVAGVRNRRDAALALYRVCGGRKHANVIGAKAPAYHDCLKPITTEFPAAKIIIIWRSPTEILRSIRTAGKTQRFFSSPKWAKYTAIGLKQLLRGCRSFEDNPNVFQLNYRLLTNDPAGTLRSICDFLGIPFHEKMADIAGADVAAVPTGIHHAKVRGDRIIASESRITEKLNPADELILARAFGALENPPWESRSLAEVKKDAARCAEKVTLNSIERGLRIRFAGYSLMVRLIYTYTPIFLLQGWRSWRDRRFAASHS